MKLRGVLAAAAVAVFFVSAVDAHGPTRQRAEATVEINAPADKVWAVVGDFGNMDWHPSVVETRIEGAGTDDAVRTLVLESGDTIVEEIRRHDDERMTYAYRATEFEWDVLPVSNYTGNITVTENDDGTSTVLWRAAFTRAEQQNDPPEHLNEDAAHAAINALYEEGLAGLKEQIEGAR